MQQGCKKANPERSPIILVGCAGLEDAQAGAMLSPSLAYAWVEAYQARIDLVRIENDSVDDKKIRCSPSRAVQLETSCKEPREFKLNAMMAATRRQGYRARL